LETARKLETKWKSESFDQTFLGVVKAPRINYVWKAYLNHARTHKRSWMDDLGRWRDHIEPWLPERMDQVTPQTVEAILNRMRQSKTPRGGRYSAATLRHVLVILRRVFNWSKAQGLYDGPNPAERVTVPAVDNARTRYLSREEIERLLQTIDEDENIRAALVIRFALFTGIRRGAILGLRWEDVDFDRGMITLRGEMAKNKRTTLLPVSGKALGVLKTAEALKVSELVFPCSTGAYFHTFSRTWYRLRKKAGLRDITFHEATRHTFASVMANSGKVDIFTLQKLLTHRSMAMTQRYAHCFPETLRGALDSTVDLF